MESSEVEINLTIELDVPIQDRTKSDIDSKFKKDPCLRDLLTPINVGDLLVAQIRDPIHNKPKQRPCKNRTLKGSEVELNIEAKTEDIELVDVPIQNGIKFVNEVEFNKDLKDNFIVKSIIDEVIQNVIEVAGQLDHGNVQHLASGKRPKFKIDTDNEKMSYYCALCDVSCDCQNDFEKHLAWVKHKEKINVEKEKHTYKSWGNLDGTEMKKVIYCCALCQVSCSCQNDLEKHLAGIKHKNKANPEKGKLDYYCDLCKVSCGYQNGYLKHLAGRKHKEKVNKEEENRTDHHCALCEVSYSCQTDLEEHLSGEKHIEKVNVQKEKQAYQSWANTEKEKITYHCFLCQVLCLGQTDHELHLTGEKHIEKVNEQKEKHTYKSWANTERDKITYNCNLCQLSCTRQTDLLEHLAGKKHNYKAKKEKEKNTYNCGLCQLSCDSQISLDKHLAGSKHKEKANREAEKKTHVQDQ